VPTYKPEIVAGEFEFFDSNLTSQESVEMSLIPDEIKKQVKKEKKMFESF
jgi:hypothetical protein